MRAGEAGVVALLASACVGRPSPPSAPYRMLHLGPERLEIRYRDPKAAVKRVLFERMNRDRALYGVPPLRYEPRGALVGDLFCLEAALAGSTGHWDLEGRTPYLRWALAGGVDFHVQNAASYTTSSGSLEVPLERLLLEAHEAMMAEKPPDDGHRRTILDPALTHVGIGMALAAGQFRMTQELTRAVFQWVELPDRTLPAGSMATFAAQPLAEWTIGRIEIRHEPEPRPLTLFETRQRRSYDYPRLVRILRADLPPGLSYGHRVPGDFRVSRSGGFSSRFRLDAGPGRYFVVCQVWRKGDPEGHVGPATAALITASP